MSEPNEVPKPRTRNQNIDDDEENAPIAHLHLRNSLRRIWSPEPYYISPSSQSPSLPFPGSTPSSQTRAMGSRGQNRPTASDAMPSPFGQLLTSIQRRINHERERAMNMAGAGAGTPAGQTVGSIPSPAVAPATANARPATERRQTMPGELS